MSNARISKKSTSKLICIYLVLLFIGPVRAASTYNFTSAEITVLQIGSSNIQHSGFGPTGQGLRVSSFLTFENPLAANTRTNLSAESGSAKFGFNFFAGANEGGLVGFGSEQGFLSSDFFISSDIFANASGQTDEFLMLDAYSTIDGFVRTDNIGNIVEWDLEYLLFNVTGSSVNIEGGVSPFAPNHFATQVDRITISSAPPSERAIFISGEINGLPSTEDFTFLESDSFFNFPFDANSITSEVGSFAPVNSVSEPTSLMLLIFAGFSLVVNQKRIKQSPFQLP